MCRTESIFLLESDYFQILEESSDNKIKCRGRVGAEYIINNDNKFTHGIEELINISTWMWKNCGKHPTTCQKLSLKSRIEGSVLLINLISLSYTEKGLIITNN